MFFYFMFLNICYWEKLTFSKLVFSCLLPTKFCLGFLLNCFAWEIKGFYQSSLGNQADFRDIMNVSPNILARNQNCKKRARGFQKSALITTTSISSYQWKTLVHFCLWKKIPENAFLTLIVNYCKIVQKNKLCYSKQQ